MNLNKCHRALDGVNFLPFFFFIFFSSLVVNCPNAVHKSMKQMNQNYEIECRQWFFLCMYVGLYAFALPKKFRLFFRLFFFCFLAWNEIFLDVHVNIVESRGVVVVINIRRET